MKPPTLIKLIQNQNWKNYKSNTSLNNVQKIKASRPLTEIIQNEIFAGVGHSVMWALIHPTIRLSKNTPLATLLARATVNFKGSP
jgi:hypothetical protein